mgnify:CR=1 FL=1
MSKPRLSICIATYNRADYIGETLESIIPQVTEEVEIVIVDGASTDNTGSVVKDYIKVCPQIHYIRLPFKGGVDQDYCKAVEFARGEYCWLFPDDDLLNPDAISTVLDEAKNGYGLIVVNARVMNSNFSKTISNKLLEIDTDEIYDESKLEQLFQRIVPYISFIGCVVINRDLWLQREKKRYFGTEFIHIGVIFQAPLPTPALVIAKPYITARMGNAHWTSRAFEIWLCKWPNLLYSFTNISEPVRQQYQPESWRRLKNVVIHRAKGAYSLKKYRLLLELENPSLWWKMAMLFIAIVPSVIAELVILVYLKSIKKIASEIAAPDMPATGSSKRSKWE